MAIYDMIADKMRNAFQEAGYPPEYGETTYSRRLDLGDFQTNGALVVAQKYKESPEEVAKKVILLLQEDKVFAHVHYDNGFINLKLSDDFLVETLVSMYQSPGLVSQTSNKEHIIIDYGGANIAKPLHVGHLRAAIIGESLKAIAKQVGHTVIGDIHLGDWGLQMGMVILEIKRKYPNLAYFKENYDGPFIDDFNLTVDDLDEIYPAASQRCKESGEVREEARIATAELQNGRPGYLALWKYIRDISVESLKKDYNDLNVHYDLWNGESSVKDIIPQMIDQLRIKGFTKDYNGATIIELDDASQDIPPFILETSYGSDLYSTTDLATILDRVNIYSPQRILYVVDNRQSLHFDQLFLVARKTHIAPKSLQLEHIGFGTVNGKDGKPFKTREGGTMRLGDLINMVIIKAGERMSEIKISKDYSPDERKEIARKVGIAAIKFADLVNYRLNNYIFDLDRFSSFEGKTGPYILYTQVRVKSILENARIKNFTTGKFSRPSSEEERSLIIKMFQFSDVVHEAFEKRAPNYLAEYLYEFSVIFNTFYSSHHILSERDEQQRESWLGLSQLVNIVLTTSLSLLAIETPERM
ncbi:MAG TPA: arginine--tRNA ligase [Patescibacteria group bacterium]|nr:arginine--tRNA ligase [Patescibacteria group bacterium]